ncbi:hypothetical protein MNBD_GAMMA18-2035 [hydrothermal vent metagenome]|uniref:Tetratricopeptide repeat protein n=1 Tax=hydrothermal vent metagenome TaxID=652676 RepID=A0A3B0Z1X6_9ZZZZ
MNFYPLVTQLSGKTGPSFGSIAGCEASLLPENKGLLLKFSAPVWNASYAEHLQRRIERNPRDLRSHTQRVFMQFARGDALATFGALADLFIVLGKLGYDLRYSMLQHVAEKLQAEHFQFLQQRLKMGLRADEQLPGGSYSRLSQGGIENYPLVSQVGNSSPQDGDDWLSLVQQCVSAGNIDQACRLMEQLVESDPGNQEACTELLALYRKHQLASDFQASYYRFSGRSLAVPESWQALDEHFKNRS